MGICIIDPFELVTDYGGSQRTLGATSPLREGESGTLELGGLPGESTLIFASLQHHQLPFIGHQGFLMLKPDTLLGPFAIGPPGNADVPFLAPVFGPGFQVLHLHVQAVYIGTGSALLGPARVLTFLDDAY
jgi:hypothetical protein